MEVSKKTGSYTVRKSTDGGKVICALCYIVFEYLQKVDQEAWH